MAVYPPAGGGNADLECGGLLPCRTWERRAVYPPAGWWNADCNVAVYPPAGRGHAGRFTPPPLPDGGTPKLECGGLPPAGRGSSIWNVAAYPLPDGVTPIWNVAVGGLPPAERGHADLECGSLPPAGRGHAVLDCGGLRRLW